MPQEIQKFIAGTLAKGVNLHIPDFTSDITLDSTTVNMTSGIQEGIGPRYGFSPIPGQSDNEAAAALTWPGLMRAENAWGPADPAFLDYRRRALYAIYPLALHGPGETTGIGLTDTYYVVILGVNLQANTGADPGYIDAVLLGTNYVSGGIKISTQTPNIYDGLTASTQENIQTLFNGNFPLCFEFSSINQGASTAQKRAPLNPFVSSALVVVTGSDISNQWYFGKAITTGDATHAPSLSLYRYKYGAISFYAGLSSVFNYGDFKQEIRSISVHALHQTALNITYTISNFNPTASIYKPGYLEDYTTTHLDLSNLTATKETAGVTYGNTDGALVNDSSNTINSSYKAVLLALGTTYIPGAGTSALVMLFQDWYRSTYGTMTQYIDLINFPLQPVSYNSVYKENNTTTKTSFVNWPDFVRGTLMVSDADTGVKIGAENTGVLRKNQVYEFTYSLYNKRLNCESNVGIPVKFQVKGDPADPTKDNYSLVLFDANIDPGATVAATAIAKSKTVLPFDSNAGTSAMQSQITRFINHLEYRFYYRPEGASEWLPALFVDAAKYWFYPYWSTTSLAACTGGIGGGLLGGYPGGFSDYSRLPSDIYTCTVFWRNRAWWLSDKALNFSNQNNIFAYSARNSIGAQTGTFKGALVHNYPGQAQQSSRFIVCGTDNIYVGRFTGNKLQTPVQVSSDTVANFDLDGSDFVLDPWTSMTAFSYRSAVVADGILYWWGPQGVFRDDGVQTPTRISLPLEPDIFLYYDASQTDDICSIYNDKTKEITWLFPPRTTDATYPTYGIVYNVVRQTWLPTKFRGQVDAAQSIKIDTAIKTAGTRAVVLSRALAGTDQGTANPQRAYFFDQRNRSGDIFPKQEMMVKTVATPATGQRRLTLAAGFDATNFATIGVGDTICLQQNADYGSSLVHPADFLASVLATNAGAGTIDMALPTGVTFDGAISIASHELYFPIWHAKAAANGINGFPYIFSTKYWVPGGMDYWAFWIYLHMVIKANVLLPSANALTTSLSYRTPISSGTIADSLTIQNNSDGNCQIFHALRPGGENMEGQGLRLSLSGIHIGSEWVLQFLEAHTRYLDGLYLKTFEG